MSTRSAKGKLTYSTSTDSPLRRRLISCIEVLTGRLRLERLYQEILDDDPTSEEIWKRIYQKLDLKHTIAEGSLEQINTNSPSIVIANHPFGVVDGVILGHLVSQRQPRFKFLVNEVLCREPLLDPYLLPIDFKDTKEAMITNIQTRKLAIKCLEEGESIVIFPSGGVATSPGFLKKAEDLEWKKFVGKLIRKSQAPVIPFYFEGSNSWIFQFASQLSMDLRLSVLLYEVTNKIGKDFKVYVRKQIPFSEIQALDKKEDLLEFLRKRVFSDAMN